MTNKPIISLVIPCYNEEQVLPETTFRLSELFNYLLSEELIDNNSKVYYVDDGSKDNTWSLIENISAENNFFSGIKLSKNKGHQNALLCGLLNAPGDVLISIDADLQDDLNIIPEMLRKYMDGNDIVYAVRNKRETDSFFKKNTAEIYYKLLNFMNVDIIYNHADYRLLSRRAINFLSEYQEVNLFLRGMIPLIGLPNTVVKYDRLERFAGESKYPLKKMFALAWQGVTSFSTFPLKIITLIGFWVSFIAVILGFWGLFVSLFLEKAVPGWASTVIPIYFLGGIQLLSLGIIGEYVAKIYNESKKRPRFHVEKII